MRENGTISPFGDFPSFTIFCPVKFGHIPFKTYTIVFLEFQKRTNSGFGLQDPTTAAMPAKQGENTTRHNWPEKKCQGMQNYLPPPPESKIELWVAKSMVDTQILENPGKSCLP